MGISFLFFFFSVSSVKFAFSLNVLAILHAFKEICLKPWAKDLFFWVWNNERVIKGIFPLSIFFLLQHKLFVLQAIQMNNFYSKWCYGSPFSEFVLTKWILPLAFLKKTFLNLYLMKLQAAVARGNSLLKATVQLAA